MSLRAAAAAGVLLLALAASATPILSDDLETCTEPRSCYDTTDCVLEVKKTVKIDSGQCIKMIEWFPLPWLPAHRAIHFQYKLSYLVCIDSSDMYGRGTKPKSLAYAYWKCIAHVLDHENVKTWPCGTLYPVGVTVSACEHPSVSGQDEVKCTEVGVSIHRLDVTPKCPEHEGTVYVTYCCA